MIKHFVPIVVIVLLLYVIPALARLVFTEPDVEVMHTVAWILGVADCILVGYSFFVHG